jgi:hypothetical protein
MRDMILIRLFFCDPWPIVPAACIYALLFLFWPVAMTWKLNYQDLISCDSNREGKKHNVSTTSKYRI